jgi:hypothetical protein
MCILTRVCRFNQCFSRTTWTISPSVPSPAWMKVWIFCRTSQSSEDQYVDPQETTSRSGAAMLMRRQSHSWRQLRHVAATVGQVSKSSFSTQPTAATSGAKGSERGGVSRKHKPQYVLFRCSRQVRMVPIISGTATTRFADPRPTIVPGLLILQTQQEHWVIIRN